MAPFDIVFSQNQFEYLVDRKAAVTTYGATSNVAVAEAVNTAVSQNRDVRSEFARIEAQYGVNDHSIEMSASFDRFMRGYFGTLNARGSKGRLPFPLSPPHHIWNATPRDAFAMQEPVVEVRMRRRTEAWIPALRRHERLHDEIVRRVVVELP